MSNLSRKAFFFFLFFFSAYFSTNGNTCVKNTEGSWDTLWAISVPDCDKMFNVHAACTANQQHLFGWHLADLLAGAVFAGWRWCCWFIVFIQQCQEEATVWNSFPFYTSVPFFLYLILLFYLQIIHTYKTEVFLKTPTGA